MVTAGKPRRRSWLWPVVVGPLLVLGLAGGAAGQEATAPSWPVVWRQTLPRLSALPQVGEGLVYVFSGNRVSALSAATGAPVWVVEPPPAGEAALRLGCCPAGATPTDNGLYTLAGGHELLALDPATGTVRWQRVLGEAILTPPVAGSSAVAVVAVEEGTPVLSGLDPAAGGVLWRASLPPGRVLPFLALADERLFVSLDDGRVAAYAAADGRLLWAGGSEGRPHLVTARQLGDGALVLATGDGVVALDAATGEPRWRAQLAGHPLDPVVADGVVYARLFEGAVVALELADGRPRWRADVGLYRLSTLAAPGDGRLYLSGWGGIVALDAGTGALLWERPGEPTFAWPLVADGALVFGTLAGDLLVLDPASGAVLARTALGAPVLEEVVAGPPGLLLALTGEGATTTLVAVRRPVGPP